MNKKEPTPKEFPSRFVLGEGYPWLMGIKNYIEVALRDSQIGGNFILLNEPPFIWNKEIPQYRLVLERLDVPCRIQLSRKKGWESIYLWQHRTQYYDGKRTRWRSRRYRRSS